MGSEDGRTIAAILAVPRLIALDFSIPAHVLGTHPGYEVLVCGGAAPDETGGIRPTHPLTEVRRADLVVVPSYEDPELPVPDDHVAAIREAAERGARIVSACTGTFAVAASGILDGRTATTHWQHTDLLRRMHPRIDVLENQVFVEDGTVLTSAGAGALIDACLHVVRSDFGATSADVVAKDLVFSPARGSTEPQYVDPLTPDRAGLRAVRGWVLENIGTPITVQRMAERSGLTRRTFIRRFEREVGMPPMRWVARQRILSARRLLENSDWSVERIAEQTGFGTAPNLRTLFRREVGTTPTAYRKLHARHGEPLPNR
ncbi:helix-turn-helix domain-containing protein [Saccharopolyspora sp. NFXS83]|uniref:GlxA family transcriptional regulator n=1 Tax=Saccharopolyspora sp. NFXS83 TaxID=2993560 RepID=UPI00224AAC75|nr:helix-turn-helix domain-containing protein [Saccharopolyspora sp. NFXS83]MCX2730835.1 helix-turn-helix domain-containing protein [Saccharopolyspora sp. NFXS83]